MKSLSLQLLVLPILCAGAAAQAGDESPFKEVDLTQVKVRNAEVSPLAKGQAEFKGRVEGVLLIKWKHGAAENGDVRIHASYAGAVKHTHDGRKVSGFRVEVYNKYGMRLWSDYNSLSSRSGSGVPTDQPTAISDSKTIDPKSGAAAILDYSTIKFPADWTQAAYVALEAVLVAEGDEPRPGMKPAVAVPRAAPAAPPKRRRVVLPPAR